jgi:hypothetical protein
MGMTDEELIEMVSVIDFFAGTNVMSSGLKIEFPMPADGHHAHHPADAEDHGAGGKEV